MKLSKLTIRNFRSCRDTEVTLQEDITALVGENASGKTNIIDAIRLSTPSAIDGRTLWLNTETDFSHGCNDDALITVSRAFSDLTDQEEGSFLAQLVDEDDTLRYNLALSGSYTAPSKVKSSHTIGVNQLNDPEPSIRDDRIAHVYLPPLRDAIRELDGGDGARIAEVLRILSNDDAKDFKEKSNSHIAKMIEHQLPADTLSILQTHMDKIVAPTRRHTLEFGSKSQELRRLAGMMRMALKSSGVDLTTIAGIGLGYANLVYLAVVVVQLEKANNYDLTLLLVEEPEAHLHPQMQKVLLTYLQERAVESHKDTDGKEYSGRIQVIVTTHSPNLVSSLPTEKVVAVTRANLAATSRWSTKTQALSSLTLTDHERRKIDRYLDVTRASLLFAKHVLLVEGIADAIIVEAVAKYMFKDKSNKLQLQQWNAVTVIAVGGVDFRPFLSLLLGGEFSLADKVIVLTDGDTKNGSYPGQDRKSSYESEFSVQVESKALHVSVGEYTLEADIFALGKNEDLIKDAFLTIHPRSEIKWHQVTLSFGTSKAERAEGFKDSIDDKTLDLDKGEFAQIIAEAIPQADGKNFTIPPYIEGAVNALIADIPAADNPTDNIASALAKEAD